VSIVLQEFPAGYTLTTLRLTLQAPRAEDEYALWLHVTDPRITTFLAGEPHRNRSFFLAPAKSPKSYIA
jgi:hypothetical protein